MFFCLYKFFFVLTDKKRFYENIIAYAPDLKCMSSIFVIFQYFVYSFFKDRFLHFVKLPLLF